MILRDAGFVIALVLGAGSVSAQGVEDPQQEWARAQRHLQRNRAEVDRLIDRRFRHDLGLPPEVDPTAPRIEPKSTLAKERMLQQLREANGQTASLLSRFNSLKSQVESLRAEAEARATRDVEEQFVVVPSPGTARRAGGDGPLEAMKSGETAISAPGQTMPNVPPGDQQPAALPAASEFAVSLGRVRGQIRGSDDHLRVAQSLFKAGQALMDAAERSREEGRSEAATELDNRAKRRLDRALAELEPLLEVPLPSYQALFCRGRCLELKFRYSVRYEGLSLKRSTKVFQQREQEVREPFLAISARDVGKNGEPGDVEVLGAWGKAANAAVEHFRWMNQRASEAPTTSIESITWPGERDQ